MTYTPPKYPTSLPSHSTDSDDLPPWYNDLTWWNAERANALRLELCAVMDHLGILPRGAFPTVVSRLDVIHSGCSSLFKIPYPLSPETNNLLAWSTTYADFLYDDEPYHNQPEPEIFEIPRTGRYLLNFNVQATIPAGGLYLELTLYINDEPFSLFILNQTFDSSTLFSYPFSTVKILQGGDLVYLAVYYEGPESLSLNPLFTDFTITYLHS